MLVIWKEWTTANRLDDETDEEDSATADAHAMLLWLKKSMDAWLLWTTAFARPKARHRTPASTISNPCGVATGPEKEY